MNLKLTKWQKNFLKQSRENGEPVQFYISDSLSSICMTIRVRTASTDSYFLTIDDRISSDSKLAQVNHFFKTGEDIGCKQRQEEVEEYEVPF